MGAVRLDSTRLSLLLMCALLVSGCLQIRSHTSISSNGRASRHLDLSVPLQHRAQLERLNTDEVREVLKQEGWHAAAYEEDGRFHWELSRWYHDVQGLSDQMLRTTFGAWVKPGSHSPGDVVFVDLYRTLSATSYVFDEVIRIYPDADRIRELYGSEFPPVLVEVSVGLPGKLLDSPEVTRTQGHTALWQFSLGPEDLTSFDKRLVAKSLRSNFWEQLAALSLIIVFIVGLLRQFLHPGPVCQDGSGDGAAPPPGS